MTRNVEKSPALPFYGKEFYGDERVILLSLAEQGLYIALLWRQWAEGSIPSDVETIAVLLAKRPSDIRKAWPAVSQFFAPGGDGRLINRKLEQVRSEYLRKRDRNALGAEITNAKRTAQRTLSERSATGERGASRGQAIATAVAVSEETEKLLTPQQLAIGQVLDALQRHTSGFVMPSGGRAAAWIRDFGADFTVAVIGDVAASLDGKNASYLQRILESRNATHWQPATFTARETSPAAAPEQEPTAEQQLAQIAETIVHPWLIEHGDPDSSVIARERFETAFIRIINRDRIDEDRWAKWKRVCGEVGIDPKPERKTA